MRLYAKKVTQLCLIWSLVAVTLIIPFSASSSPAKEIKIKMSCVLGPGTAIWKASQAFSKRISERTGDQIKIKVYSPGSLVGPTEVFEALGKGLIDMAFTTGEYWAGKNKAFAFVTYMPGGFDSPVQHDFWLYERGGLDLVRQLYEPHGIHLLSLPYYPAEFLTSRTPIKSLEDLKGKKLVFSGAMPHMLFNKLGASTVSMPTGERVAALERGVIDGGDLGAPNLTVGIGAHRVAKYMLRPSLHQPSSALELSINMKLWQSLPDNFKTVFTDEAYELAWRNYRYNVDMDLKALDKMRAGGLKEFTLPESEVKKVRELAKTCWHEAAMESELGKKLLESQLAVMKEFNLIE
ncbi:TRAP transporter substrate-binding protein DctP [Desulfotignum balticum]|uniref:TRAP transporter substrate-binding protein DctP n=1 Tax=Desulfotignum balticum TaxID=115781 RepID=UPI0004205C99|nr:TRAP transporter substrate-binding protein DctP [Desulfotignum balticum]